MIVKVLAGMLGTVVAAGAVAFSEGAVSVRVLEKKRDGHHIRLPAMVVPLGMRLVPNEKLEQASAEMRPWLPAIKLATQELAKYPDGPFVEVRSPREQVTITKQGGALVIDVDSNEETVHVSVPLRMVNHIARQLEALGPPS